MQQEINELKEQLEKQEEKTIYWRQSTADWKSFYYETIDKLKKERRNAFKFPDLIIKKQA